MEDLMQMDLYELIGTVAVASVKEIKTAYRKKALTCHPDKNPDNPKAAELFHQLSRALEILTDDSARAAYDKVIQARHRAKERVLQYDAKRKKFKDDLEAREEAFRRSQSGNGNGKSDEQRLKAEIERLQKEGSRQVEEEVAFVRQQIHEQLYGSKKKNTGTENTKIKIKWKAGKDDPENGGYDYDTLHRILSKHGDIAILVVSSSKKGSALVEYKDSESAETAVKIEIGLAKNPLTLRGLWESDKQSKTEATRSSQNNPIRGPGLFPSTDTKPRPERTAFSSFSSAPDIFSKQSTMSDAEFENSVLQNMRRAEERKRLIEKLEAEETT